MSASSVASPLCTWLVAACMSVTCDRDHSQSSSLLHSSKRLSRWGRRRKVLSKCSSGSAEFNRGLISSFCGSSIQGLMSSCLAFEPCNEYYSSKGLSSLGYNGFPSLFGSKSVSTNRRQRRINRVPHSGNYVFQMFYCCTEFVLLQATFFFYDCTFSYSSDMHIILRFPLVI